VYVVHPLIREKSLRHNELTSLVPASERRSHVAHPLHFARPSNNRDHPRNRPSADRQYGRRAELAQNGEGIRPVALRDRIAMWVTSHECVERAPHERCS
jgi:hypothetical protein